MFCLLWKEGRAHRAAQVLGELLLSAEFVLLLELWRFHVLPAMVREVIFLFWNKGKRALDSDWDGNERLFQRREVYTKI